MAKRRTIKRQPVDYTYASPCESSMDGGLTWQPYKAARASNKRQSVIRSPNGEYVVKVTQ